MNHLKNLPVWIEEKKYASGPVAPEIACIYGYWKMRVNTRKIFISPALKKILGISPIKELGLREAFNFLDMNNLARLFKWIKGMTVGEESKPIDIWIRTQRNELKKIRLEGHYFPESKQDGIMFLGTAEDLSTSAVDPNGALAILDHEIRNPLSVIKLNAQLLEKISLSPNHISPEMLTLGIIKSIDAITALMDRYLSEKKGHEEPRTEFDLGILIEEAACNFTRLHPGYGFFVQADYKCLVRANRLEISQVINNYLSNAVKFSPTGSRIAIHLKKGFSHVEVAVSDEGIGIPECFHKKIFECYFKVDYQRKSERSSRGLGLFLIKEIIENHKGNVWVQRARTGGSTFFFSLPELQLHN